MPAVPALRPEAGLAAIRVPVPAIAGDKDLDADPSDLDVIARIVPGPASLRNHREQYHRPVDPALPEEMAEWVSAHLQGPEASAQD